MAEVQHDTQSGETAARFIEFVMMQAQNASLFLGLIPNPSTNQPEVNLELARLFIDQLSMIQEKTRGNLNTEETGVLRNALTHLQMAFVEVSQDNASGGKIESAKPSAAPVQDAGAAVATASSDPSATSAEEQPETKKRFTKSYGG